MMTHRARQLAESLRAFEPADVAEREDRRRMLALIEGKGDPFSRDRFDPGHFTASAFVLSPDLERLLLIFHDKLERWLQPGGHIDPGDCDVLAAAAREVWEEAGLSNLRPAASCVFDLDIHRIPANPKKREPTHEHFDVRYLFVSQCVGLLAASDARRAKWTPLGQITENLTDRSVMRAVGKLRTRVAPLSRTF